jgi:hypothetical protein
VRGWKLANRQMVSQSSKRSTDTGVDLSERRRALVDVMCQDMRGRPLPLLWPSCWCWSAKSAKQQVANPASCGSTSTSFSKLLARHSTTLSNSPSSNRHATRQQQHLLRKTEDSRTNSRLRGLAMKGVVDSGQEMNVLIKGGKGVLRG